MKRNQKGIIGYGRIGTRAGIALRNPEGIWDLAQAHRPNLTKWGRSMRRTKVVG